MNRLSAAVAARRRDGRPFLDLTISNPTRAGFDYPVDDLERILGRGARAAYSPDPFGLLSAREAVARSLTSEVDAVSPDDLVLTASTSEAYSFLFKLLADPGDCVLVPTPSYPLLEHLAVLSSVQLRAFPLEYHAQGRGVGRWAVDLHALERAADDRTRAIIVIHPNNPTGSYLRDDEMRALAELCASRDIALISDEVFYEYPLVDDPARAGSAASTTTGLSFSLGGLSKSAALPHWKLGWIRVGGPAALKREALEGLELIADTFLSVATPVQEALPEILEISKVMREQISERTRRNLAVVREITARSSSIDLLPVEGGWSAVLRVPRLRSDEDLALELFEAKDVLVQPGYFFDFHAEGFVVVSLLCVEEEFAEGMARVVEYVGS